MLQSESAIRKPRRISSSGRRRSVVSYQASGDAHRRGHTKNALGDPPVSGYHQVVDHNEKAEEKRTTERLVCCGSAPSSVPGNTLSSKRDRSFEGDFRARKPQLFKGPAREATPDQLLTHSCPDCQRFASLLLNQNISKSVINSIIRHKSYCEPSSTPPNIWEPWSQG